MKLPSTVDKEFLFGSFGRISVGDTLCNLGTSKSYKANKKLWDYLVSKRIKLMTLHYLAIGCSNVKHDFGLTTSRLTAALDSAVSENE